MDCALLKVNVLEFLGRMKEMSLIIDLFVVFYLGVIVLAFILGIVWTIPMIFSLVKTICPGCLPKHLSGRIMRMITHG